MANGKGNGKRKGFLTPGKILGAAVGGLIGVMGGLPGLVMGSAVGLGATTIASGAKEAVKELAPSSHARKRSSRKRSRR
jgi:hypothetical protein